MTGSPREGRIDGWVRPEVRQLKPYYNAPLAGNPLRLDQNTNLSGANPALGKVDPTGLDVAQYPSRDGDALLAALAEFHALSPDHFTLGNGGDETFDLLVKAFGEPGTTLATPWPSYGLYPFYANLSGMKFKPVPTKKGFAELDVEALLATKARLTFVANPNNPTGARFAAGDLERLVQHSQGVVVVDEAYIEYAGLKHSFLARIEEFDNLVVLRTFSKAYGLAGLRIGVLAANRELTRKLRLVKPPFNLNLYSERVAIAALDEQAWVDAGIRAVRQERERLATALKGLGLRVHPSEANFLLCESRLEPGILHAALLKRGILARTFAANAPLQNAIRFTVGRPQDNDALLAALKPILEADR